jgi:hypothetical protein
MLTSARLRLFDWVFLAALTVVFFAVFHGTPAPNPYTYDEADYMAGVRLGFSGNFLDTNAMTLPEFVDMGLKAKRKEISRDQLSDYIRGRRDPMFLRHYHGPINEYWLVLSNAVGGGGEHWMRLASIVFHVLSFLTVYLGILWVFGEEYRFAAALASVCYLFCVNNIGSIAALSAHAPYLWLSILTLFFIAKLAAEPAAKRYYWALAWCTVSFCAVEYAALLYAALAVTLFAVRREFFLDATRQSLLRFVRNTLLLVIGVFFVLWPSSILKLTIVQGAAYTIFIFGRGSYSGATPWDVWKGRFEQIPMDMAFLGLALVICVIWIWRSPRRVQLLPFVIYAGLLGMTTLKNTNDSARYISSLFAPLYVTAAVLAASKLPRIPAIATAALAAVMAFVAYGELAARPAVSPLDETVPLVAIMRNHPAAKVLVPAVDLPTLAYYFPEATIRSYAPTDPVARLIIAAASYDGVCFDDPDTVEAARDALGVDDGHQVADDLFFRLRRLEARGKVACYFR